MFLRQIFCPYTVRSGPACWAAGIAPACKNTTSAVYSLILENGHKNWCLYVLSVYGILGQHGVVTSLVVSLSSWVALIASIWNHLRSETRTHRRSCAVLHCYRLNSESREQETRYTCRELQLMIPPSSLSPLQSGHMPVQFQQVLLSSWHTCLAAQD